MVLAKLSRFKRGLVKMGLACAVITAIIVGGVWFDNTFSDKHTPAASTPGTHSQLPAIEAYLGERGLSKGAKDAFTCNMANANSVKEWGEVDAATLRPCLHGWAVFELKNGKVSTVTPFGGITMSVNHTFRATLNGVETTFTTLRTNNNRKYEVVIAAVRSKTEGGQWGSWKYAKTEGDNYPNGGYQHPYQYQVALALFDPTEPATSDTNLQTPSGFSWELVLLNLTRP